MGFRTAQALGLCPSRVSQHSRLERAFNCSIHLLVVRETPVLRVVTASAVLVDGDSTKPLPPDLLQPADGLDFAEFLSSEIEVFAPETWDLVAPALGEHVQAKSRNDTHGLFFGRDWDRSCTHFTIRSGV